MADLSPAWSTYRRIQAELSHNRCVDSRSWGAEAALDHLLAVPHDDMSGAVEETERASASAARRERYRAKLRLVHLVEGPALPSPEAAVTARRDLDAVRSRFSEAEWTILSRLAVGWGYAELAAASGKTVGSLRVKVVRIREKLPQAA